MPVHGPDIENPSDARVWSADPGEGSEAPSGSAMPTLTTTDDTVLRHTTDDVLTLSQEASLEPSPSKSDDTAFRVPSEVEVERIDYYAAHVPAYGPFGDPYLPPGTFPAYAYAHFMPGLLFPLPPPLLYSDGESDSMQYSPRCFACYALLSDFGQPGPSPNCKCSVCRECQIKWCETQIDDRRVTIQCPAPGCSEYYTENFIRAHLTEEYIKKFERYQVDMQHNPFAKTCPYCGSVYRIDENALCDEGNKDQLLVTCEDCFQPWCFRCHGPLHPGKTCAHVAKRDKKFNRWNKKHASRCPQCRAPIQKVAGCDHMHCKLCDTHYCYSCGAAYDALGATLGPSMHRCKGFNVRKRGPQIARDAAVASALLAGFVIAVPVCAILVLAFGVAAGVSKSVTETKRAARRIKKRCQS